MDAYSAGKAVGIVTGIIAGLIICVILFRYINKDKKIFTKYDERQQMARGRAYMYGFWAVMIATAAVICIEIAGITLASRFTTGFFVIFVGIMVQVSYSIFNDAYYGINTNKKRFAVICILAGLANLLGVVGNIKGGSFIVDGVLQDSGTNLMCVIMLFAIAVELFIKERIDLGKTAEEESGD